MRPALPLLLALAAAGGAVVVLRRRAAAADDGGGDGSPWAASVPDFGFGSGDAGDGSANGGSVFEDIVNAAYSAVGSWRDPPADLAPLISQAESDNGIPTNLLARQLWQESRYRANAVNASTGAQGIAQVMPATARSPGFGVPPLVNPFDPAQAIPWAGRYMRAMYRYTGSWPLALAAYNWGPGNAKTKPQSAWPTETQNYVAQITSDVGYA